MEIFPQAFNSIVPRINNIVINSGEKMEGNLFYFHHHNLNSTQDFHKPFAPKRKQIVEVTKDVKHILEIGFNAGHSAALMLTNHANLKYSAIDICMHKYTEPCAALMKQEFGNRFAFFKGDSARAYPFNFREFYDCDMVHIDGGHSLEMFRIDTLNAIFLPRNPNIVRHLLIDDVDLPEVRDELKRFCNEGYLRIVQPEGFNSTHHVLCEIIWKP